MGVPIQVARLSCRRFRSHLEKGDINPEAVRGKAAVSELSLLDSLLPTRIAAHWGSGQCSSSPVRGGQSPQKKKRQTEREMLDTRASVVLTIPAPRGELSSVGMSVRMGPPSSDYIRSKMRAFSGNHVKNNHRFGL